MTPDTAAELGAPVIRIIAMPSDANPAGDIFGGWLMSQMALAVGSVAARFSKGRAATIAVEAITFRKPVHVGDEVTLYAELLSVGRTSMRVHVAAWRRVHHEKPSAKVTDATFTFVGLDAEGRPRSVVGALLLTSG